MKGVSVWVVIISSIACLAIGFVFANWLNRSEIERLRAGTTVSAATNSAASDPGESVLTEEEIAAKLAEAERNSGDFQFQRNLGLGLYRYAALRKDKALIERSIPVLQRAFELDPKDYDVSVGLGNAYFDVGYYGKENQNFAKAREFYGKGLDKKPDDVEVRTDVGLTYFLQQPPDYPAATAEFEKALKIDPKHEKTLQFIAQSVSKSGGDPAKYLDTLRSVSPKNPVLAEFASGQMK